MPRVAIQRFRGLLACGSRANAAVHVSRELRPYAGAVVFDEWPVGSRPLSAAA